MKSRISLLLVFVIFSLGAVSMAEAAKPYALHYEVKLKSDTFGNMGTRALWIKGNQLRWEYESANLPLTLVKNEEGVFLIHPFSKIAAKYPDDTDRGNPKTLLPGPTGSPKAFLKAVDAKAAGTETIHGKKCDVYSYTEPVSKRRCKLWVGEDNGKPVQLTIQGEDEKADTITATYVKFVEGARVDDSMFAIPEDYAVRDMPNSTSKDKAENSTSKKSS